MIPVAGRTTGSWYKMGLLNALIHFHPRKCLEIGTRFGGTARVFNQYFAEHEPTGTLVTCDIAKFRNLNMARVTQVLVPPHSVEAAREDRFFAPQQMLEDWEDAAPLSVAHTSETLRPYAPFDFVYIDGDHSYDGVSKDWQIVARVTLGPTPVVLDDVVGQHEGVVRFYEEICQTHEHYEFADWPVFVGLGAVMTNPSKGTNQ
jgi:predicted O-methyltransferase YrrM